jgi:hexosaminidase
LSGSGAYGPRAVYTASDLGQVVSAATDRGIRVVPEVDMPGHSFAVGKGYPGFVATCPSYAHNINNIPLNPANRSTFSMVQGVISQLASTFSDPFIHLGGDEVIYGCWLEDPNILAYMQQNNISTPNDLMKSFVSRVVGMSTSAKRSNVFWQEVFQTGIDLSPETVIEVWKDEPTLLSVAQAGVNGLQVNSLLKARLSIASYCFHPKGISMVL